MAQVGIVCSLFAGVIASIGNWSTALVQTKDYPVQPVPFTHVQLRDAFWSPRIETNRTVTIPFAFQQCEQTGRMKNFDRAAAVLRGEANIDTTISGFSFDDSDVFKVIEGASYAMAVKPDAGLDAYVDKVIAQIACAQEPDGYLFTARTINPRHPHDWAGPERWVRDRELSHELYNLGHLYEAAVAHHHATGKRSLLDVAIKTADLLDRTFGPGKQAIWPGHQITEMGLVKLYRVTGDERYLRLAKFLLDVRGPDGHPGSGNEYNQSHKPVIEQAEAVGHAVRATYMYAGMADVAAISGDASYVRAIDAIWDNVARKKLYITGGIGSTSHGEAFGPDYDLPNMSAYCETCAAIANVYWNHRLFLLHADAKYVDVLERSLYNGVISGISLDGKGFFYPNPLESRGQHARSPWFGCACCPSNICRFMASIPGYVYAQRDDDIFINLYAAGSANLTLSKGRTIELEQQTFYPWDGTVKLMVKPASGPMECAIKLRIPGWARDEVVAGDLYRFADTSNESFTLRLNGQPVQADVTAGYVTLRRAWAAGDVIELQLPMPVRRVLANEKVKADRARVALQRGPIVYCLEWPDNPDGRVRNTLLRDDATIGTREQRDLLGGVVTLATRGRSFAEDDAGARTAKDVDLVAIPYYAWAHRGRGEMTVWIARTESAVHPARPRTIAETCRITVQPDAHNPDAMRDHISARERGEDHREIFCWWPRPAAGKGSVDYTFLEPERVSEASVYFFDDTGRGGCKVPTRWRILYRDTTAGAEGAWRPVTLAPGSGYTVTQGAFDTVRFEPITTPALRLELDMQDGSSSGIEEWRVK
jgi:uncharacterized protein